MTTATIEKAEKVEILSENEIINLLFKQVNEPDNVYKIKVINVFDNAYRINIWTEIFDDALKLNKIKISHSYFCKLNKNELFVKS